MSSERKLLIPCSGIGKAVGEVSREAARIIAQELRPGVFDMVCLAAIMSDGGESGSRVRDALVYTIDGCPKKCATKLVEHVGGTVAQETLVVKVLAKNRDHKPKSIIVLGESGLNLARDVAESVIVDGGV